MSGVRGSLAAKVAAGACTLLLCFAAACGSSSSSGSSGSAGSGGSSSPSSQATSTPSTTSTPTDESFCSSAKKANGVPTKIEKAFADAGTDPTKLKVLFTQLTSFYQKLISAAPSDIKPSLEVVFADYQKVVNLLAKNNYNFAAIGPQLAANDPFNTAQFKAAVAKIDAWAKANHCM